MTAAVGGGWGGEGGIACLETPGASLLRRLSRSGAAARGTGRRRRIRSRARTGGPARLRRRTILSAASRVRILTVDAARGTEGPPAFPSGPNVALRNPPAPARPAGRGAAATASREEAGGGGGHQAMAGAERPCLGQHGEAGEEDIRV